MNNKHEFVFSTNRIEFCFKCNERLYNLINAADKANVSQYAGETYGDYVDRAIPCLTDEEIIIKKALE
jgi:hypothetical protein